MDIRGKRLVAIGGAGLIGSHTVDQLFKEDVREVVIYDNFVRGTMENLAGALRDPRVKIFEAGGDITQTDILDAALKGADGSVSFRRTVAPAVPRIIRAAAFEVNVYGTFNVLDGCVRNGVKRLVWSSSASVYGDAVERADGRKIIRSTTRTSTARRRSAARRWRAPITSATASTTSACAT